MERLVQTDYHITNYFKTPTMVVIVLKELPLYDK